MKSLFSFLLIIALFFSCQSATQSSGDPFIRQLIMHKLDHSNFSISIPSDYIVSEKAGPDFSVYYFEPKKKDSTAAYIAGLYFGNHPGVFSADSCKTEMLSGNILGRAADWNVADCDGKITIQTVVENGLDKGWNRQIHGFGSTTDRADLQKILAIYSTLEESN